MKITKHINWKFNYLLLTIDLFPNDDAKKKIVVFISGSTKRIANDGWINIYLSNLQGLDDDNEFVIRRSRSSNKLKEIAEKE